MNAAYSALETDDLWRAVEADPDDGLRSRATGAEITDIDRGPSMVDLDLSAGLWPVLIHLRGAGHPVTQLLEQIEALVAQEGAGPVASSLATLWSSTLWSSTAYDLRVDVNYPSNQAQVTDTDIAGSAERVAAPHARLARELREITGLPAASIGAALGVTREQYQRWVAGSAISDTRHGQLIYLHTIAVDVLRRLGPEQARLWWKTPVEAEATPEELLKRRRADRVYRLVAAIPDRAPVVDGVMRGLPVQDDVDFDENEDSGAWSPYGDSRG
jgi:hypothetical protein